VVVEAELGLLVQQETQVVAVVAVLHLVLLDS
jgi:hypothetical protein